MKNIGKNLYKKIGSICLCFLTIFLFSGCWLQPLVTQEVAKNITIDKNRIEIRPTSPLKVSRQDQEIYIEIPDLSGWDLGSEGFITPTGDKLKIDVELINEEGSVFILNENSISRYGLGFSRLVHFPENMKFTSVRFRSNIPFQGGKVIWLCTIRF